MSRAATEITINGEEIGIFELTVGDIRNLLQRAAAADGGHVDIVDAMLFDDIGLCDLAAMTTLDEDAISAMRPSDLRKIADAAKEVNRHFFDLRGRVLAVAAVLPDTASS